MTDDMRPRSPARVTEEMRVNAEIGSRPKKEYVSFAGINVPVGGCVLLQAHPSGAGAQEINLPFSKAKQALLDIQSGDGTLVLTGKVTGVLVAQLVKGEVRYVAPIRDATTDTLLHAIDQVEAGKQFRIYMVPVSVVPIWDRLTKVRGQDVVLKTALRLYDALIGEDGTFIVEMLGDFPGDIFRITSLHDLVKAASSAVMGRFRRPK